MVEASPPPQQAETVAEAAVAVAEIQAERDVSIAQEQTRQTEIIAAASNAETDEDLAWLRGELDGLRGRCVTSEEGLLHLQAAVVTLSEQNQQMAEQLQLLTARAVIQEEANPLTPEPGSEPPANPEGGEDPEEAGIREPPQNPDQPVRKRERKWL